MIYILLGLGEPLLLNQNLFCLPLPITFKLKFHLTHSFPLLIWPNQGNIWT